jgi:hypothetical protein
MNTLQSNDYADERTEHVLQAAANIRMEEGDRRCEVHAQLEYLRAYAKGKMKLEANGRS